MKKAFTADFLQSIVWEENDEAQLVEDKITDTTRWSVVHEIVFKHEGKHWSSWYSVGATEMQDEQPWQHVDEADCTEVHLVPGPPIWAPLT